MRHAVLLVPIALFASSGRAADPTARQIVERWREAVHAPAPGKPRTAALVATSREGGIPGKVEEWLTTAGD